MSAHTPVKHYKVVTALLFVCVALISLLFVIHLRQKTIPHVIAPEVGTIFPVGKMIKAFELVDDNEQKFSAKNLLGHYTLMFFGFTHCPQICPNTLNVLEKSYATLKKDFPNLQIVFVSLDPERDSPEVIKNFLTHYHHDFIGVSGKIQDLRKLQSQLGIYSTRDSDSADYQIQHTTSLVLIDQKGQWSGVFKYGLTPAQLTEAVQDGLKFYQYQQHS